MSPVLFISLVIAPSPTGPTITVGGQSRGPEIRETHCAAEILDIKSVPMP